MSHHDEGRYTPKTMIATQNRNRRCLFQLNLSSCKRQAFIIHVELIDLLSVCIIHSISIIDIECVQTDCMLNWSHMMFLIFGANKVSALHWIFNTCGYAMFPRGFAHVDLK